jgi:hypothetical protein
MAGTSPAMTIPLAACSYPKTLQLLGSFYVDRRGQDRYDSVPN